MKRYIASHKHLIPAKRQQIAPQGNRGRRYTTGPGETYQMDWGFTDVLNYNEQVYRVACFAMICHHCGECYIEFFPNAKQENLFIGMIHAFQYMGIPRFVLTDNMKSVILHPNMIPQIQIAVKFCVLTSRFDTNAVLWYKAKEETQEKRTWKRRPECWHSRNTHCWTNSRYPPG